jgi:SAM-dependent methyltransferase
MSSYCNWGITIDKYNEAYLKSKASEAYTIEWQPTGEKLNALVAMGSKFAGLSDVNANMCKRIGEIVASDYKPSATLDLGTGTGHPSFEVYTALYAKGIRSGSDDILILNDSSILRVKIAEETIRELPFWQKNRLQIHVDAATDMLTLRDLPKEKINIIISNAAIHHHSDNDHLYAANEALVPNGRFVNGDWHECMWQKPERAYWMFAALVEDRYGNREVADDIVEYVKSGHTLEDYTKLMKIYHERHELTAYRKYFGISMLDTAYAFNTLTKDECLANAGIMQFWRSVDAKCTEAHETAPIQIFEAHETVTQRKENMTRAGFTVLATERVETGYGELATVMASVKLRK